MTPGVAATGTALPSKRAHFDAGSPASTSASTPPPTRPPSSGSLSSMESRFLASSALPCEKSQEFCDVEYQKLPETVPPVSRAEDMIASSKVDAEAWKERREDNVKSALLLLVIIASGTVMLSLYSYVIRIPVSETDRWIGRSMQRHWGSAPTRDSESRRSNHPRTSVHQILNEPFAKSVIRSQGLISTSIDFEEDTDYGSAFAETTLTPMLFFGDRRVATTTTYGLAFWAGDLFGVKAPQQWVTLRMADFYAVKEEASGRGRISSNFLMVDWADALRQIGRRMLPPAPLQEGTVLPPAVNDGIPAPRSVLVQSQGRDSKAARHVAEAALQQDWASPAGHRAESVPPQHWHDDLTYYGPGGIGLARSLPDYTEHVLGPFRAAFANRTAVVELSACEGNYCGMFGHLAGHGVGEWLGLPTVGHDVSFRFAMHYRVIGNKVQEGWAIFDFPGLFAELGLDFHALAAAGGRFEHNLVQ